MHGVDERALHQRFAARIRGYGLRHLRDRQQADDLVQHVLLAAMVALREGTLRDEALLPAWVLSTCRNTVMDLRRGASRQQRVASEAAALAPASYEPSWSAVDRDRLQHCLEALAPKERGVVLATFVEDREPTEICTAFALSPGNVRVVRHRALLRLRDCVEGGAK